MNVVSMVAHYRIRGERSGGYMRGAESSEFWREEGVRRENKYLFTIEFRLDEAAERSLPTIASMARDWCERVL